MRPNASSTINFSLSKIPAPFSYNIQNAYCLLFPKKNLFCMHMAHIFFTNVFDISMFNPNVKQHVNDIKQSCKESAASAQYYQQQHRLLLAINNCVIAFSADSFHLIIYPFSVQPPMCKFSQSSLIVFCFSTMSGRLQESGQEMINLKIEIILKIRLKPFTSLRYVFRSY